MTKSIRVTPDDDFENYWNKYLNEVIRRKIEFVIEKHQKEIFDFRKEWDISPDGFKTKRPYNRWYKNQLRKFKSQPQIVYQHEAEVLLETQRFGIKIPQSISPKKSTIQSIKVGKGFLFYFWQRVLELAHDINLDDTWGYVFKEYVLFNGVGMRYMPYSPVEVGEKIYYSHRNKEITRKAILLFGPNTRLKDVALIWKKQIEPLLKTFPGYIEHPPRKKRKEKQTTKSF